MASGSSSRIALRIAPTSTPWFWRICFGATRLNRMPKRNFLSSSGHLILADFLGDRTSMNPSDGLTSTFWVDVDEL